jgi:hypothetical protein
MNPIYREKEEAAAKGANNNNLGVIDS